jgi:transcriptional regulator with XRE-family HTH domain
MIDNRGMTEREFAQAAGIAQSGLSNILSEKAREPDAKTLRAIASYLGIDAIILFRLVGYIAPLTKDYGAYSPLALYVAHRFDDLPDERQMALLHVIEALTNDIDIRHEIKEIRDNPNSSATFGGMDNEDLFPERITQIGRWYLTNGRFSTADDIYPQDDEEISPGLTYGDIDTKFRRRLMAFLRDVMSQVYSSSTVEQEDR